MAGRLKNATAGFAFGITEPDHGSDATWMETGAVKTVITG